MRSVQMRTVLKAVVFVLTMAGVLTPTALLKAETTQGIACTECGRLLRHAQRRQRSEHGVEDLGRAERSEHGRTDYDGPCRSNPRTRDRSDRKYGPAGQLLESRDARGTTKYEYDGEGNLTRKTEPDGGVWTYAWNGAGMLERVKRPDGIVVEFAYDALGRRVSKTYRSKTTRWIWDGNVPLHEWVEVTAGESTESAATAAPAQTAAASDIAASKREALFTGRPAQGPPKKEDLTVTAPGSKDAPITWLFEPESFAPLAKLIEGKRYSIVTDHLGTPLGMYDDAGGEVWGADIDTYGDLRNLRGERQACPFRWPGQYEDGETGLYYNVLRYYENSQGNFISQDPIRLAGGSQLHSYVADPLTMLDPFGLASCDQTKLPKRLREQLERLRQGDDVTVNTIEEARALLHAMPELKPHTFDRRLPVPDSEGGHSNPFWKQQRGTYRGDLINKSAPAGQYTRTFPQAIVIEIDPTIT